MSNCGCEMQVQSELERRTLLLVLAINAFMFVLELALGIIAQSTGLIADSLDMFADASVYGISLYAIGKEALLKTTAAKVSGVIQVLLALLVLVEVLRRFMLGSEPVSGVMISVGMIALFANVACLRLIGRHRDGGIHMRASLIFTANDVIANAGVIVSGALVWLLNSRHPDLVIGLVIAIVVMRGGIRILKEAAEHKADATSLHD